MDLLLALMRHDNLALAVTVPIVGPAMGYNGNQGGWLAARRSGIHPYDQVVVYASIGGRFRAGLRGTVMVRSRRIGGVDRVIVLLDQMTADRFAVLEVSPADVLRVGWLPPT